MYRNGENSVRHSSDLPVAPIGEPLSFILALENVTISGHSRENSGQHWIAEPRN